MEYWGDFSVQLGRFMVLHNGLHNPEPTLAHPYCAYDSAVSGLSAQALLPLNYKV
jgi:hypothetical protein